MHYFNIFPSIYSVIYLYLYNKGYKVIRTISFGNYES